jgi:hypothetical protein
MNLKFLRWTRRETGRNFKFTALGMRTFSMTDPVRKKSIPVNAMPFEHPLSQLAAQLKEQHEPIRIVAIGSSSTAGEGGVVPYPWWMGVHLRERFPGRTIDVLNRGKGGQEAPTQLARFASDVLPEQPCLVVWQVGTNAVVNDDNIDLVADAIGQGVDRLREKAIDVLLMDPQYAPPLLAPEHAAATKRMLSLIGDVAARARVNVFQRFAMMQAWYELEKISVDRMINTDDVERLHHSEWSTRRIAWELANAIDNASR